MLPQPAAGPPAAAGEATLVRGLGTVDATLLTVGSVVGTGIFLTTSDIARLLPRGGWILAVWVVGGLLTLAGALTYAELGAMFPRAGGIYRSEEHTSELQSQSNLVCRLLLEKKNPCI